MNTKQYLGQIRHADIRIDNLIKERENWRNLAECCGALPIEEKIKSTPKHDKLEVAVINILEVSDLLGEEVEKYITLKKRIINEIEYTAGQNHAYYELLYKRYVENKDFCVISREMNYGYQTVINMHGDALKNFEKNL